MSEYLNKIKKYFFLNGTIIIDVLYYIYFIVAIAVKVFYLQFTTKLNVNEVAYNYANAITMKAAISIILMIFAVIFLIFKKKRNFAMFVVNILLSILFLADTLYFRYYNIPVSISLLYQLKLIGDVTGSIGSLYKIKDIIYFIDLPIYFIVLLIKFWMKKKISNKVIGRKYAVVISAFLIIFSLFRFNNYYNGSNTIMYNYDRSNAAKDLSILYYHYFDVKGFFRDEINRKSPIKQEDKELVDAFFEKKQEQNSGIKKYAGIAKDRNIIAIQVEALQEFVIGREINGKEITPFINSLINESAYFSNIYNQVAGGNTSDAEFIFNNSLYPISSGAVYFRYPNNKYYSLPNLLENYGYSSYALHPYKASFWNRQVFYKNCGFEKFYSLDDFNLDEKIGWAVSDESFYRQMIDKINFNEKVYSFGITLSSHHPYDGFIKMDNLDVGKYKDKQLGWYLKAANYVDYTIKILFDNLKEKGIYDNSIIVIYGDHSALYEDQVGDLSEFLQMEYNSFNWKKIQKVPFIIHVPGTGLVENVAKTGGQIDMLPTIANLLGIDSQYMLGKDLLNLSEEEKGYAVLRYTSVITDEYMYLSDKKVFYDMESGEEINSSVFEEDLNEKLNELKISDIIINKDYFKRISH